MSDAEELKNLFRELEDYPDFLECRLQNPNDVGNFGNTPLHQVAGQGNLDAVLMLIRNGADVNAIGDEGYTPLHDAVEQGHEQVVQLLAEHGARLDMRNSMDFTPLELAEALGGSESLQMLLRSLDRD